MWISAHLGSSFPASTRSGRLRVVGLVWPVPCLALSVHLSTAGIRLLSIRTIGRPSRSSEIGDKRMVTAADCERLTDRQVTLILQHLGAEIIPDGATAAGIVDAEERAGMVRVFLAKAEDLGFA